MHASSVGLPEPAWPTDPSTKDEITERTGRQIIEEHEKLGEATDPRISMLSVTTSEAGGALMVTDIDYTNRLENNVKQL